MAPLIAIDGDIWTAPESAIRLFTNVVTDQDDPGAQLPKLEASHLSTRYTLTDENEEPIGRLFLALSPVASGDKQRLIRLELTARGTPVTPDLEGVEKFFDLGRETIVRAFTAVTTKTMHDQWKRSQ